MKVVDLSMIRDDETLYDLTEEQQLALIEFDKRNYKIIGNPCIEATKLYLRKNDYKLYVFLQFV